MITNIPIKDNTNELISAPKKIVVLLTVSIEKIDIETNIDPVMIKADRDAPLRISFSPTGILKLKIAPIKAPIRAVAA